MSTMWGMSKFGIDAYQDVPVRAEQLKPTTTLASTWMPRRPKISFTEASPARSTEAQHRAVPLVHTGVPEGEPRLAAVEHKQNNEWGCTDASFNEPATGVQRR